MHRKFKIFSAVFPFEGKQILQQVARSKEVCIITWLVTCSTDLSKLATMAEGEEEGEGEDEGEVV